MFEEAKRCPKCGNPGEDRKTQDVPMSAGLPPKTTVHLIYCVTKLCPWFDTCWSVQVNPDGSIPTPRNHSGEAKVYAGFETHDRDAKAMIDYLKAQELAQTQPGAELPNPFAR